MARRPVLVLLAALLGAPAALCVTSEAPSNNLNLDLPVTFQLTKTRLQGPRATTMTESYRETWTLEVRTGGVLNLRSPRATVPAFAASVQPPAAPVPEGMGVPRTVLVSERDLARLIGLAPDVPETADDAEAQAPPTRPVTIQIGKARSGTDVTFNWSDEEHYAIHIDVGTNAVY